MMSFLRRSFLAATPAIFAMLTLFASAEAQEPGTITEYPLGHDCGIFGCILPASLSGIAVGPDGALWFTEQAYNTIGRITRAGVIKEYNVPTQGSSPYGIAAGPDGALWFTETQGYPYKIGRITTAGVITEYPLSIQSGSPYGIAAGPDGALWFTEPIGNKIGRITTAGVITEYPIPTANSQPVGIAAGPDGALWFTESFGNPHKIGRITTAGLITEYTAGTFGGPYGIAAGPDGALWFTEEMASPQHIGRITTAGVFTEYLVPSPGSEVVGIVAGTDGALWFTEQSANKIGRITTAGVVTEYRVPSSFPGPYGIASGPDGALWFTEYYLNNIGRVVTGISPPQMQTGTITINSNLSGATFLLTPSVSGAPTGGPYPVTINSASAGQYNIRFADIQGYVTPALPPQTLTAGGTISFNGQYVAGPPPMNIIILDATQATTSQYLGDDLGAQSYSYTDTQSGAHTYHVLTIVDSGALDGNGNPLIFDHASFGLSLKQEGTGAALTVTVPSGGDSSCHCLIGGPDQLAGGTVQLLIPFGLTVNKIDGINVSFGNSTSPITQAFACVARVVSDAVIGYMFGAYYTGFQVLECAVGLLPPPAPCSVVYPILNDQSAVCLADPNNNSLFGDKVLNTHQIRNIRWKPSLDGFKQSAIQFHLDQMPAQVLNMIQQKGISMYVHTARGDFWLDNFR